MLAVVAATGLMAATAYQMKWTATLKGEGSSSMGGTATLAPGSSAGTSVATIEITGGEPNHTYPWHVHTGKCGTGGVFGSGAAYKPVKTGADGSGKSTADLSVAPPQSGDYHVNVHASSTDMKTIAACGEFSMAGM
jgi:hypothetical protein